MYLPTPDPLSQLLERLDLNAEIYVNGDFCGAWAVDTSGSRRIPFHVIGSGEAWLHMPDQPPTPLSAGSLVMFPRDDHHIMTGSKQIPNEMEIAESAETQSGPITNMICGFFEFKSTIAWPLLDSLDSAIVFDLRSLSTQSTIKTYIDLIIAELKMEQAGHRAAINTLAYLLFVQVLRQQIATGAVKVGILAALFDARIGKALTAIHSDFSQAWTLDTLASVCAMGRSSFAKHFNELVGMPAMQYLTQWRMQEATQLLQTTQLGMFDIASRCGYESEAAFRKAYKKTMGHNAAEVRKKLS